MVTITNLAELDAQHAAERAGVCVRTLHAHAELVDARELWDRTWPSAQEVTQITPNLLRAVEHSGSYVSGAYAGDRLVGAAFALVGRHRHADGWGVHLHSHMAATEPDLADRGVGTAMKLHQRAWALGRDIPTITWTYDPLVRRNARLNLVKLGTSARTYLVDFYGDMTDGINAGDPSDRLLADWDLAAPRVTAAIAGHGNAPHAQDLPGAVVGLARDETGHPVVTGASGPLLLVAAPQEITALRRLDPAAASAWRVAVREVLAPALAAGAVVTGLTLEGDYIVENS